MMIDRQFAFCYREISSNRWSVSGFVMNLSVRSASGCIEFTFFLSFVFEWNRYNFLSSFFWGKQWSTAVPKQPWLRWEDRNRLTGSSLRFSENGRRERKFRKVCYFDLFDLVSLTVDFVSVLKNDRILLFFNPYS